MEEAAPDSTESAQPIEQEPEISAPTSAQIVCPQCGTAIAPANISGPIIECPNCKTQFFSPTSEDDADTSDGEEEEEKDTEAELSELRIRQLITLQRTAYRTRSYLVVGTLACMGFAIQFAIFAIHRAQDAHHWGSGPMAFLLFAFAGIIGSYKFAIRTWEVQRDINADRKARELEEQEAAKNPPDLSTLSDGSQHARNLAQMFANERESEDDPSPESGSHSGR